MEKGILSIAKVMIFGGFHDSFHVSFLGCDVKVPKEMASLRQELEAQEVFSRQESSLAKERMVLRYF